MISLIHPILLVGLNNHYMFSQFDPILIMHLRNHYAVSILILLIKHVVVSQFYPILSIRLSNHVMVSQFGPILVIRLGKHVVLSQKLCISESKQLFRWIIFWTWRWEKLNGLFNSSTANFFPIKNQYRIIRINIFTTLTNP